MHIVEGAGKRRVRVYVCPCAREIERDRGKEGRCAGARKQRVSCLRSRSFRLWSIRVTCEPRRSRLADLILDRVESAMPCVTHPRFRSPSFANSQDPGLVDRYRDRPAISSTFEITRSPISPFNSSHRDSRPLKARKREKEYAAREGEREGDRTGERGGDEITRCKNKYCNLYMIA